MAFPQNIKASGDEAAQFATALAAAEAAQTTADAAQAAFVLGFSRLQNFKNSGAVSLVATTGSHSIPGPATGFIRVIFHTALTSGGVTPAITAQLQPSGLFFGRAVSPGGTNAASAILMGTTQAWCLGFGETMDVTNTGAAGCTLYYTYFDIPATNRTLVRTSFSSTPVTVIPAAAAGFYNRWFLAAQISASTDMLARSVALGFNDDTAAAIIQDYLDGVLIGRQSSTPANSQGVATNAGGYDLVVTTQAYQLATVAAVTTRNVNFMGCYETFAGVP